MRCRWWRAVGPSCPSGSSNRRSGASWSSSGRASSARWVDGEVDAVADRVPPPLRPGRPARDRHLGVRLDDAAHRRRIRDRQEARGAGGRAQTRVPRSVGLVDGEQPDASRRTVHTGGRRDLECHPMGRRIDPEHHELAGARRRGGHAHGRLRHSHHDHDRGQRSYSPMNSPTMLPHPRPLVSTPAPSVSAFLIHSVECARASVRIRRPAATWMRTPVQTLSMLSRPTMNWVSLLQCGSEPATLRPQLAVRPR